MRESNTSMKRMAVLLAATVAFSQVPVNSMAMSIKYTSNFNEIKNDVWYSDAISKWGKVAL